MKEVVEDVGEDEDFNSTSWVSATEYVNANGGIMSGCLSDIDNFLNNGKLDQVVAIVKSCSPNMIGNLTVTMQDLSDYILQKQVFVDNAHYDMPLIYNVEGRCLHFGHPEFSLITWLPFGSFSFRTFNSGDVKFVSRVLPHKLGLKVTNLDLLGVIEGEELFGKLVDDDVVCVCLLLALEVIFIGKKLVDEVPDTHMRLIENLDAWNNF
nr:phospholipase-like protein [Tanacetum cinerariifolium]